VVSSPSARSTEPGTIDDYSNRGETASHAGRLLLRGSNNRRSYRAQYYLTTVSGFTMAMASFHSRRNRMIVIQKMRSLSLMFGRFTLRL